jgi:hypothetical protein
VIDCDVHNQWPSAAVLLPYLEPPFRDHLERGDVPGPPGALADPRLRAKTFSVTVAGRELFVHI